MTRAMPSIDRAPLLIDPESVEAPSSHGSQRVGANRVRELVALTRFQLKNSFGSSRPAQVFLPLLFYLGLLVLSRSAFPDKLYPEISHPSSFFSESQCDVSRESRGALRLGVVCKEAACLEASAAMAARLGVGNVTQFNSTETLSEAMLTGSEIWTGISYDGSITLAMRGGSLPNRAATMSGNFLECRPGQQCAVGEYERGCLGLVAEAALNTEIEWKLFPMSEMFVSGLKASSVLWLVPVYVSFLFVNLSVISLVDLAREIERKSIDFMHTHGVRKFPYFLSFTLVNLFYGLSQIAIIAFVLKNFHIFPNTSSLLVTTALVFFFLFLTLLTFILVKLAPSPRAASLLGTAVDVALLGLGVLGRGEISLLKFTLGIFCPSMPLFGLLDVVGEREALGQGAEWAEISGHLVCLVLGLGVYFFAVRRLWRDRRSAGEGRASHGTVEVLEATKIFTDGTRALRGLSLELGQDERLVLIGPNGAGKTTLQRSMLGLEDLDQGTVRTCERVGACFQEDVLYDDVSVADHITLIRTLHGVEEAKVNTLQAQLDITEAICERKIKNLSGGEKRRVTLLLTLLNVHAGVLVLDEPTAGVDVEGRRHMWEAIKHDGRPCIISTHYLDEATEIADRIVLMRDGQVVEEVDVMDERMTAKILTVRPANAVTGHAVRNFFPDSEVFEAEDALSLTVSSKQTQSIVACVQYLESSGENPEISIEPQSLEALLASKISTDTQDALERDIAILNRPLKERPSVLGAAWAFGRVRVLNKLHSVQAAGSHFLVPLLMVAASIVVVKMNRFLMGNAGGPELSGWGKINFSDPLSVSPNPFTVPFASGADFSLPESIPRLDAGDDIEAYLLAHPHHPFAVGLSNVIYVNPIFPNALPYVIGLVGGASSFELVPVLSVVELTILSVPAFLPFVLYFALALHRLAVDGAVTVAEEKATQSSHFWEMHGLKISSYWLGTFAAQLALCAPVVLAILALGSVLFELSADSFLYLVFAGLANTAVLLLTSFVHAQSFPLTPDAFLKWYPAISGIFYEGATVTAVMAITALYSAGNDRLSLAAHALASLFVPTYPLVGSLMFLLVDRAVCEAPGLEDRCSQDQLGKFLWTPVAVQIGLAAAGLTWLAWQGRIRKRREYLRVADDDESEISGQEISGFYHVHHTYDNQRWALRDLSFRVKAQDGCLALLGPNGSGKSTAMEIVTEFLFPTAGRVASDERRSGRGYCAQQGKFLFRDGRVTENVKLVGYLRGAHEDVEQLSVVTAMGRKSLTELSGGMRRRVEVIIAMIGNPDLVILDEPTSGVDVEKKREIWRMIGNLNSVILSSHSMEEVQRLANKVMVLVQGERKLLGRAKTIGVKVWGGEVDLPWKKVGDGRYVVDKSEIALSEILASLEKLKRENRISNYTVGGNSVEDDYLDCVTS